MQPRTINPLGLRQIAASVAILAASATQIQAEVFRQNSGFGASDQEMVGEVGLGPFRCAFEWLEEVVEEATPVSDVTVSQDFQPNLPVEQFLTNNKAASFQSDLGLVGGSGLAGGFASLPSSAGGSGGGGGGGSSSGGGDPFQTMFPVVTPPTIALLDNLITPAEDNPTEPNPDTIPVSIPTFELVETTPDSDEPSPTLDSNSPTVISNPEPSSMVLFGLGGFGMLVGAFYRRRSQANHFSN